MAEGKLKTALIVGLVVVVGIVFLALENYVARGTRMDFSDQYELVENDARCVKFLGEAEVRSEPIVLEENGPSNSFGTVGAIGFLVEVSVVYGTDRELDGNGEFVGLSVEEILDTPEGKEWLPKSINEDLDGIVWVDRRHIRVVA